VITLGVKPNPHDEAQRVRFVLRKAMESVFLLCVCAALREDSIFYRTIHNV